MEIETISETLGFDVPFVASQWQVAQLELKDINAIGIRGVKGVLQNDGDGLVTPATQRTQTKTNKELNELNFRQNVQRSAAR